MKYDKTVTNTDTPEPSININERYRTIARPGSESSVTTALTPVGSPHPGARPVTSNDAGKSSTITVQTAQDDNTAAEETVKNVNANKLESIDGVPNPGEVENDRITRTARYYFQPTYN